MTINPAPTADAGQDQVLCESTDEIILSGAVTNESSFVWTANLASGSAGSGTFTPDNDVNTTYNPSPTDIASGSVILSLTAVGLDGCTDVTDSMVVSFEPQPIVDAGTDASICEECLNEIFNVDERRYFYPLTNCTLCGPRFSIMSEVPYDRIRTSMAPYKLCSECREEFSDPSNRRFHAQPIACPKCGPKLKIEIIPNLF